MVVKGGSTVEPLYFSIIVRYLWTLVLDPAISSHWEALITNCVFYVEIALSCDSVVAMILPYLPSSVLNVSEPEGKAALIWMLGEYGKVRMGYSNNLHNLHVYT